MTNDLTMRDKAVVVLIWSGWGNLRKTFNR